MQSCNISPFSGYCNYYRCSPLTSNCNPYKWPCYPPCPSPCDCKPQNPCCPPEPCPVGCVDYVTKTTSVVTVPSRTAGTAPNPIPANSVSIPANTVTLVNGFSGTPVTNIGGVQYNSFSGQFSVPRSGKYLVSASMCFTENATGDREFYIYKVLGQSGLIVLITMETKRAATAGETCSSLTFSDNLVAGDKIFFAVGQNSGSTLDIDLNGTFSITLLNCS